MKLLFSVSHNKTASFFVSSGVKNHISFRTLLLLPHMSPPIKIGDVLGYSSKLSILHFWSVLLLLSWSVDTQFMLILFAVLAGIGTTLLANDFNSLEVRKRRAK